MKVVAVLAHVWAVVVRVGVVRVIVVRDVVLQRAAAAVAAMQLT
jgi:hypothetical protein